MGTNIQVCWEKFCRYWQVEPRLVPMAPGRLHLTGPEAASMSSTANWPEETSDELPGSIGSWLGARAYGGRSVRRLLLRSSAARARAA